MPSVKSAEFRAWYNLKYRCNNTKATGYQNYGGRGIRVCDQWSASFETFLRDMGTRPSPRHSIDRIDVNGHYEPGNCRWAVPVVQATNRRPRPRKSPSPRIRPPRPRRVDPAAVLASEHAMMIEVLQKIADGGDTLRPRGTMAPSVMSSMARRALKRLNKGTGLSTNAATT